VAGHTALSSDRPLNWYACGPTVYDDAHIGHARTYINTDIMRRVLVDYFKFDINFAMGMTDIDDKIVHRARERETDWKHMARHYESSFFYDMEALNVKAPDTVLRVTEHIDDIILYIEKIISEGKAYSTNTGVYFDVSSTANSYGKLGNIPVREMENNDVSLHGKRDPRDFALWKFINNADSTEVFWESPWGRGRPGWHIECSAMSHAYFGHGVDIHSGGIDLRFPHHTNEIAQSEAHGCCDHWVSYWLHTGHLHIDGLKMSKSLKNFITIDDYLTGRWRGEQHERCSSYARTAAADLRIFFLQHKYHSALHFSLDRIGEAVVWRKKLEDALQFCGSLQRAPNRPSRLDARGLELQHSLMECRRNIKLALGDDFDTPSALGHLQCLAVKASAHARCSLEDTTNRPADPLPAVKGFISEMLSVLGLHVVEDTETGLTSIVGAPVTSHVHRHEDTFNTQDTLGTFVSYRADVRSTCLKGLQTIKRLNKNQQAGSNSTDIGDACQVTLNDIMKLCDSVRSDVATKSGLEIKDVGDKSTWKFKRL